MWLARYAGFRRPNSHLSSGGLGTMGYALPAAMGAALGRPDKETWAVAGDGGLQMTAQEMLTFAVDRIPVQDRAHGQQEARDDPPVAGDRSTAATTTRRTCRARSGTSSPRPTACRRFRATTPEEVDAAIRAAQAHDGPALVWFEIAETQNVFPMMPAGKGLSDLIETWGEAAEGK